MLTIEKINIFTNYRGDIDGPTRNSRSNDYDLITDNEWALIDNFFQDIELINKRLAAQTYVDRIFLNLKDKCDQDSFELFTSKIEYYKDFLKIADILRQIKSFLKADTDIVWSRFDSLEDFLADLNQDISNIENCNFVTLDKVHTEFLPTSTYQEISISNGWGHNYIELSTVFDKVFINLTERKTVHNRPLHKSGRSWWQQFFHN
jgi:hypothetical protein